VPHASVQLWKSGSERHFQRMDADWDPLSSLLCWLGIHVSRFSPLAKLHSRQRYNWDCALASCVTVLVALGFDRTGADEAVYRTAGREFFRPLWTIDALLVLVTALSGCGRGNNIEVTFYTQTIGIADHHRDIGWYSEHMNVDEVRVAKQFQEARDTGSDIRQEKIHLSVLADQIEKSDTNASGKCYAIMLVDNHRLLNIKSHTSFTGGTSAETYSGHYIVLVDFDRSRDRFVYLNPAGDAQVLFLTSSQLDRCRDHPGTDNDCIVVRERLAA
jgi:Guanylylate cyclase